LAKHIVRETKDGGIDTTIKYVAIDGMKNNEQITVVKTLLAALLAEYKAAKGFNEEFKVIKDEKGNVIEKESGIQAKRIISPFLNSNKIYKTDTAGKISGALECEKGVCLRDTALNIKEAHAIVKLNSQNLKFYVHNQAKAIIKQSNYLSTIEAKRKSEKST
jgi:hypothetical protein